MHTCNQVIKRFFSTGSLSASLMASTDQPPPPSTEPTRAADPESRPPETAKGAAAAAPAPATKATRRRLVAFRSSHYSSHFILRLWLLATTLAALVLMVTSNQTQTFTSQFSPAQLSLGAEFGYWPAFVYFVAAMATACFYSILSLIASICGIFRSFRAGRLLLHLLTYDALMMGVVSSATGAAAAVVYIGSNGNSHVGWNQVCNTYDKFCKYVVSSLAMSLAAAIILLFLVVASARALHRRSI